MFLSLFCISISIRICFLDIPCIIFSFMTWVKVTWGLRISLRRIQVHFIINRVYDRYNVWIEFLIKTCYIFVMTKETAFEMLFYQKSVTLQIDHLCIQQKTCACLYLEQPIIITAKRLGILIFCCEFRIKNGMRWEFFSWDRMPISKAHTLLHVQPVLHIKLQTTFPCAKSCFKIV